LLRNLFEQVTVLPLQNSTLFTGQKALRWLCWSVLWYPTNTPCLDRSQCWQCQPSYCSHDSRWNRATFTMLARKKKLTLP